MRRSICTTEPSLVRAGEKGTWYFRYTTAIALPKGAKLKLDCMISGARTDWEAPSVDLKQKENVIYGLMPDETLVKAKGVKSSQACESQFEFTLPAGLKAGEVFTFVLGAPHGTKTDKLHKLGNRSQLLVQRRRPFHLYIDPKGKGVYSEPEVFLIDIKGNRLHKINILAPSFVTKNKRFDVTVRFEDEYANLTNFAPEGTLIDLSYEHLRENLNWKLFVPETGFVILPNLYFNEAGIYKIQLKSTDATMLFTSAPIKCFQENTDSLFWGWLHGESDHIHSENDMEACLRECRDEKGLQFFASSPFESAQDTSAEQWKGLSQHIADFCEEDRFITFSGFQYVGEAGKEGVRHILYCKDGKPLLRQQDTKSNTLGKIYKSHTPKDLISIPSFTMAKDYCFDFEDYQPEFERVVEIYNVWGSSECTKKEGNLFPITGEVDMSAAGSLQAALKRNCRFGFVAGGWDHRGLYANFIDSKQARYTPGLTGIIGKKQSREGLLESLYKRACYATTGPRIIVGFFVAGQPMGSELSSATKKGLLVNRHLSGYVAGTANIKEMHIIRNGEIVHKISPGSYHCDFAHDDMQPLEKIVLDGGSGRPPFVYYYLRVIQEDGAMAWSSPIWVDLVNQAKKTT